MSDENMNTKWECYVLQVELFLTLRPPPPNPFWPIHLWLGVGYLGLTLISFFSVLKPAEIQDANNKLNPSVSLSLSYKQHIVTDTEKENTPC